MKKNETMPFAAIWMDSEIIKLSEVKSEKDKHHIICIIPPPQIHTNELIYKTELDFENKHMVNQTGNVKGKW